MPKKVDNIIAEYAQSYDLQLEQPEGLPPLPGEPPIEGGGMPPVEAPPAPAPEPIYSPPTREIVDFALPLKSPAPSTRLI